MKKYLIGAAALTVVSAGPAYALAEFDVTGTVAATCSYSGGTIAFGAIGTGTDGTILPNQTESSTAETTFYCNGNNTTLALAHVALTNDDVLDATAPFTRTIDFTPEVTIGGGTPYSGPHTNTPFGAQASDLVVTAKNLTASGKLLAGDYSGSITLTLTPAI